MASTSRKLIHTPHSSSNMLDHTERLHFLAIEKDLVSVTLSKRQLCDLEFILNGGFSPLTGFLTKKDYLGVLINKRLHDGALWPIPIIFDVDDHLAEKININDQLALRDEEGLLLAILCVEDQWEVDKEQEALAVFGTTDPHHPGVNFLNTQIKNVYLGGTVKGLSLPHHYNFQPHRHTPAELKNIFHERGWKNIIAFQTRNPMHRAHQALTHAACEKTGANLLIHPVVGMTKPGDVEAFVRVRCYEHILRTYPAHSTLLSLLPLAMRMAGPREALWHALIRKNYGCTHFIVGRDHAGPGKDLYGKPFYEPYEAQKLALSHQNEMGIEIVPFQEMVYSQKTERYYSLDQFPKGETPATISGTELRKCLEQQLSIPEWFSYPAVIQTLRQAYPKKTEQGFTLFLTGLPSSGKSTLAHVIYLKLRELTNRTISLLDGDRLRVNLSKNLGFSREDRETHLLRTAFVAAEITKHRGIAICALIAPYHQTRKQIREMINEVGAYIEVYVSTPLAVCEERDRKGLYQKARLGVIQQFTGISDVYEQPSAPEIMIDTSHLSLEEGANIILKQIQQLGYLPHEAE